MTRNATCPDDRERTVATHKRNADLSDAGARAERDGEVRVADFVERGGGVGASAGVVEAQRVDDRLAPVDIVPQVELAERRRRVGHGADAHVARVDVQAVRDVPREPHGVVVLLLHAARDVEHEHHVHLLAATCHRERTM